MMLIMVHNSHQHPPTGTDVGAHVHTPYPRKTKGRGDGVAPLQWCWQGGQDAALGVRSQHWIGSSHNAKHSNVVLSDMVKDFFSFFLLSPTLTLTLSHSRSHSHSSSTALSTSRPFFFFLSSSRPSSFCCVHTFAPFSCNCSSRFRSRCISFSHSLSLSLTLSLFLCWVDDRSALLFFLLIGLFPSHSVPPSPSLLHLGTNLASLLSPESCPLTLAHLPPSRSVHTSHPAPRTPHSSSLSLQLT